MGFYYYLAAVLVLLIQLTAGYLGAAVIAHAINNAIERQENAN